MPTKKTHFTITEAAKTLKMSKQGVLDAIRKGRLAADRKLITRKIWIVSGKALNEYRVSVSHQRAGKKSGRRLTW